MRYFNREQWRYKDVVDDYNMIIDECHRLYEQTPVVFYAQEIYTVVGGLRTPVDNDGTLDKDITSYNDIFDAFRLALKFYHFEPDSDTNPY